MIQKPEQALRESSRGIDYQAVLAQADRRWPLVEFAKQLATYLGRQGGLTAFTTDELETLNQVHQRLSSLDASLLGQACQKAQQRTIPEIVFVLQQLDQQRRE